MMPLDATPAACPDTRAATPFLTSPRGYTVRETAERLAIPRAAFVALCEAHDVLELRPCDGTQRRRFVTDTAEAAGIGWNVFPFSTAALRRRKGHARTAPFAVFNPARLEDLAWMLDWPGIVNGAAGREDAQARRAWLLAHHGHLPDKIIAGLAGYSRTAVQKARREGLATPMSRPEY